MENHAILYNFIKTIDKRALVLYNGFTLGERFSGFRSLKIDLKDVYRRVILYDCAQSASVWGKRCAKKQKAHEYAIIRKMGGNLPFSSPKRKRRPALPSGVWYAIHVLFAIYTRLYCKELFTLYSYSLSMSKASSALAQEKPKRNRKSNSAASCGIHLK